MTVGFRCVLKTCPVYLYVRNYIDSFESGKRSGVACLRLLVNKFRYAE